MPPDIAIWTVTVDDAPPETFDTLDVALAYLRGYIGTNGSKRATLESGRMNGLRYAAEVEAAAGDEIAL